MESSTAGRDVETRVLLAAPGLEDGRACRRVLADLGVPWRACEGVAELARETAAGAGAILLTDEALAAGPAAPLEAALAEQPPWSDMPMVALVSAAAPPASSREAQEKLGNVLLVERPFSDAALQSAIQVALRSRRRQYEARDRLLVQEQALADAEAEFQAMFDSLSEVVVFADPQRRIVMVNPAFTALFGYEPDEVIGRTTDFLYADEGDYESQGRSRYRGDVEPPGEPYEIRYRRKDGSTFLAESAGAHVQDRERRLIGFVSLHRDVTERHAARELLERRERDYRTLAANLPALVYRVHLREDRRMQFFTDLVETMTGYGAGELTRGDVCSIDPLILPEDRPAVLETVGRAIAERHPFEVTYRIRSRAGEERHLTERGRPVYGDDDRPAYIDGVIFDVTDHWRAETALAESEERLRQMAGSIAEVFFLVTPDWNQVLYISPAYETVWGRPCQGLYESARSWLEAVVPDDRPVVIAAVEQGVTGDLPKAFPEYRILRPDGTERWIEARGWPVLDGHGNVYRVAGIAADITERKKAEEALRQGRDELQALLDSTSDGLVVADIETRRLVRANSAICRMLGYSAEELLSLSVPDIHPPETASLLLEKFDAFPEGGLEVLENMPVRARDGTVLRVDLSGRNVVYRGRPCAIGFFHDVTRRVGLQRELEQAKAAAETANEAKSRFLANTSHDLRTPMNAILGMTGLALEEDLSPTVRDYLETAREAATTLLGLLDQVLDVSRIEARKLELHNVPFRLRPTVEQVIRTLGLRAEAKGLELVCDWPADVPERVVGDPLRLRQLLLNLLDNAVKFTPAGEVVVRLGVVSRTDDEVVVGFSIADTGIGVAPADQQRIFEPFQQADASTTREHGGSGLGLAIVAGLVERMGGQIQVQSQLGRGTTVDCTLPLKMLSPPQEGAAAPLERLRDVPVLIVAESATSRRALEKTLARWSLAPESVADGSTALGRLREAAAAGRAFRLVLADRRTARIDGLALARALKREPALAEAIVLMVPARERASEPLGCTEVGAVCLEKPVLPSKLQAALAEALGLEDETRPYGAAGIPAPLGPTDPRLRVLLAEDSPAGQKFVERLLSRRGHQVQVASDGEQAVAMIQQQDFDVVLMDVQMPRSDGFQATAAIRALAQPARARLPVVALTAHALKGEAERCLAAGMDAYLSKPVDARQLIELVERLGGVASDPSREAPPPEEVAAAGRPREIAQPEGDRAGRADASSGVFDVDEALRACYGDQQVLQDMIEFFFDETDSLVRAMRSAVAAGEARDLARHAHHLKTTVVYLAARPAVEATQAVEGCGMSGSLAGAGEAVERLAGQLRVLGKALSGHRRDPGGRASPREV